MSTDVHRYRVTCTWSGSTGEGYEAYGRAHTVSAPPADATLRLSADPVFRGDATLLNPEQLFVLAVSSCQLLEFLAVAARARIDIVGYEDDAEGVMPEDDRPTRLTRIVLRPRITVRGDVTDERLRHWCEVAHNGCYIANSISTEVVLEPTFVRE